MGSACWDRPPVNTGRASESLQSPVLPFKTRLCISFLVTPHYFVRFALVVGGGGVAVFTTFPTWTTRLYFHYLSLLSSWVGVRVLPYLLCLLSLSPDSQLWWLLSFMDWEDICISVSHKIGIVLLCLWPPFSVSSQYCALIFYLPQFCPPTFAYCNSSLTFHPTSWCPSNIYFLRSFVLVATWAWPTKCYLKKGRCLWCPFFLLSLLLRSEFEVH